MMSFDLASLFNFNFKFLGAQMKGRDAFSKGSTLINFSSANKPVFLGKVRIKTGEGIMVEFFLPLYCTIPDTGPVLYNC